MKGEKVFDHRKLGDPVLDRILKPEVWLKKLDDRVEKFEVCENFNIGPNNYKLINYSYEPIGQRCVDDKFAVTLQ